MKKNQNNKYPLYIIVIILIIASLAFRVINDIELEQTSILFVGIPALITLLLIKYTGTPESIYGVVFKTITLFLLMSGILLGEGLVCIIFMAPIFYGVAALLIFIIEYFKKRNKSKLNSFVIIPLLLIISQISNINSAPEVQTIETKIIVSGNQNINNLNQNPDFVNKLPNFFKIGFPKPIAIQGNGMNKCDTRQIQFESNTKGIGTLLLKVKRKTENLIIFEVVSDNTHIDHWLSWKEIIVKIDNTNNDSTEITWTTKFTCDLGPAWYFEPLEKYAVNLMNKHLINSYFN